VTVRLAALIANFESGAFALACARSVRRDWLASGRDARDLELVVADDASPSDQKAWLERAREEGAFVVERPERGGYAAAMASALERTSGGPADVVAALNADVLVLPGALDALLGALQRDPQLAAVAPRAFATPSCALELPPQELPTPASELCAQAASLSPKHSLARSLARTRRALRAWNAASPYAAPMLSGACLLLRRAWIERAGGLFDARFPLYFEDTDLCRRLTVAGGQLAVVPGARIVHFWARSTGLGEDFERRAAERWRASRRLYLERWHSRAAADAVERGEALLAGTPGRDAPIHAFADLGAVDAPPVLELARPARFVLELGLGPTLPLAAGSIRACSSWQMPGEGWDWLHSARYFARALELPTLAPLGAWSFDKRAPSRCDPCELEPREAARGGPRIAA
jgi:GT2 family glycosyltransferase